MIYEELKQELLDYTEGKSNQGLLKEEADKILIAIALKNKILATNSSEKLIKNIVTYFINQGINTLDLILNELAKDEVIMKSINQFKINNIIK
jgi:hypothetical protein